jgi:hypothetical protein
MTSSTASIRILALCGLALAAGLAYGQGHSPGGAIDFFVHHLLGVEPPDWNSLERALPEDQQ